jgi:fumarate reductase flavoprotein subunit
LHALLRAAVGQHPAITLLADAEVTELLVHTDPTARVTGARVRVAGALQAFASRAVLLATGGFAANPELLAQYIPEMKGALHIGAGANDGCAVRWGRALGAEVAFMQGYQGQGHVNPPEGRTRLGMALPPQGAFMVNRLGHRFVAEDIGPSELASHVLAQPGGVALEVFDERIHRFAMAQGPYREAFEAGKIVSASSAGELANRFDIPEREFVNSFQKHQQAVAAAHDPEFGRTRFGPALQSPFFGAWVTGALAHTQGGLRVDRRARVLRTDGSVIEGLYAAGGAAASVSGVGGAGYLPGNGLAQSFALARLAALDVSAQCAAPIAPPEPRKSLPPA